MRHVWIGTVAATSLLWPRALAAETVTYTYDALGRLSDSAISGGPNSGVGTKTCFDAAGNRTAYAVSAAGAAVCTTSSTGNPPAGGNNQPPVANPDSISVGVCASVTKNVTANDTDPEGHYPLTVIAVGFSSRGSASISSASTIDFYAYGTAGSTSVSYTIQDSQGATATGTLYISVTNGQGCM